MTAAQAAENYVDEWGLIWCLPWGMYIYQFKPGPPNKIQDQQQKQIFKKYPPMKHLLNDYENYLSQHKNSHKLSDEKGHLLWSLRVSQWKLRQQHDQNFT